MFEHLNQYRKIIVTGPQRSGTRIAAKMIAHDLGEPWAYVDELVIMSDSLLALYDVVGMNGLHVIQCPSLSMHVHLFAPTQGLAVVMMRRKLDDILASQARIGWRWEDLEQAKIGAMNGETSAEAKWRLWEQVQRPLLQRTGAATFDFEYSDLAGHPLWLAKDQRREFMPLQTERVT